MTSSETPKLIIPDSKLWVTPNHYELACYYKCDHCNILILDDKEAEKYKKPHYMRLIIKNIAYDKLDEGVVVVRTPKKVQQRLF